MEMHSVGGSEVKVTKVVFGAWAVGGWMWGGNDHQKSIEAIRASIDSGVTSIDTAPVYGQGVSEQIVGEAIRGIPRDEVQILTKCGLRWDAAVGEFFFDSEGADGSTVRTYRYAARDSVLAECEASLRRLGTDHIDLYQLHWPDPTTPIAETMDAFATLVNQGKVRAVGVSNFSADQMHDADQSVSIVSNQVPYSMVNRGIETDLVPYCIEHGKGILAYSALQRGLLTGKFAAGHVFAPGDHRAENEFFSAENIRRVNVFLDSVRPIADGHRATVSQLAIAWAVSQPGITAVLAGARDALQARANAVGGHIRLSDDEQAEIRSRLAELKLEGV